MADKLNIRKTSKNVKTMTQKMSLSQEKIDKAFEIARNIDHTDQDSLLNFGLETQKNLGRHSDELLNKIKARDAGDVGETINELMNELNYFDADSMTDKKPFYTKIPLIGPYFDSVKRTLSKFDSVSENIDDIVVKLDNSRKALMRDNVTLDNLFDKNVSYIEDMDVNIQAGYFKMQEIVDLIIPAKKEEIKKDQENPVLIQELNDLENWVGNLEKKIHDLELSKMVASQNLPQIRMIQNNSNNLVEKIQSSVMNVIPMWKAQVTTALALNRQKRIADASKKVTDTTNKLLQGNAEMLKINTINITKQTEESIISVDTIKKTNKMLIDAIDEIQKIKDEGRRNRERAKLEIAAAEEELTNKILNYKNNITSEQVYTTINQNKSDIDSINTETEINISSLVDKNN